MKRGFTLIELLAVMAIIIILVGLVIGIAGNVQKSAARNRAKVEVAAIEAALERYKIDNGDYPEWAGISTNGNTIYSENPSAYVTSLTNGTEVGDRSLFEQLVGRENYDSQVRTGTTYIEVKKSQVGTTGNYFADPFGSAYGYYYDPAGNPRSVFNRVGPDLWSTADEHAVYLNWVTNWSNE